MTVSSTSRRAGPFTGNGIATSFPFTFKTFDASDVQLTHTDAAGTSTVLVANYLVTLNADQDNNPGGTITYPLAGSPMAVGELLAATGSLPFKQALDLTNAGRFLPQAIEDALDRATILVQQLQELAARTIVYPATDSNPTREMPAAALRPGKYLAFDGGGNPVASFGTGADAGLRTDLAASTGSSLGGHIAAGTGAATTTAQIKLREFVTPEDYYLAVEANATGMIQRALNTVGVTSNGVRFNPSATYTVSDELTVTAKTKFQLWGAGRITQTVANKRIFHLTSCGDFEIHGLHLYGLGTDFNPVADGCLGDGIFVDSCFDFSVHHNTFKNFGYCAVRASNGCFGFGVTDNRIYGTDGLSVAVNSGDNYQFGVIIQSGAGLLTPCLDFEVSRNRMRNTAIGVRVEPGSVGYELHQNIIANTKGQHGFYLNGSNFSVIGNTLRSINFVAIKLQSYQNTGLAYNQGISNATVTGNTVNGCQTGVSVEKTSSLANNASTVTVNTNTLSGVSAAGYGIILQDVIGLTADGNTISGGAHGIIANVITAGVGCQGRIANNNISDTQWAAVFAYSYGHLAVTGNTAIRPCLAALAADAQKSAFYIASSSTAHRAEFNGNTLVVDTSAGVVNGLFATTVDLFLGDHDLDGKPITLGGGATVRRRSVEFSLSATHLVASLPAIANGASSAPVTFAVAGAAMRDYVFASFESDLQGCSMSQYVSSAGNVSVVFTNNTGGAKTLADGFLRVGVMPYVL